MTTCTSGIQPRIHPKATTLKPILITELGMAEGFGNANVEFVEAIVDSIEDICITFQEGKIKYHRAMNQEHSWQRSHAT